MEFRICKMFPRRKYHFKMKIVKYVIKKVTECLEGFFLILPVSCGFQWTLFFFFDLSSTLEVSSFLSAFEGITRFSASAVVWSSFLCTESFDIMEKQNLLLHLQTSTNCQLKPIKHTPVPCMTQQLNADRRRVSVLSERALSDASCLATSNEILETEWITLVDKFWTNTW